MARDTEIRQGSLSNVLTGKRTPGGAIVSKVANHPAVNTEWLLSGTGAPLLEHETVVRVGDSSLPVLLVPFDGAPQDNIDSLKPYQFPIHWSMYRESRFWVEIDASHSLLRANGVIPGDRILFESDRSVWPKVLDGHPCIRRKGRGKNRKLAFGIVGPVDKRKPPSGPGVREQRTTHIEPGPFPAPPELDSVATGSIVALGIYRCGDIGVSTHD